MGWSAGASSWWKSTNKPQISSPISPKEQSSQNPSKKSCTPSPLSVSSWQQGPSQKLSTESSPIASALTAKRSLSWQVSSSKLAQLSGPQLLELSSVKPSSPFLSSELSLELWSEVYSAQEAAEKLPASFNLSILYGKETDFKTVVDNCRQFPMMAPYRLVIVKEAQEMRDIKKYAVVLFESYSYDWLTKNN